MTEPGNSVLLRITNTTLRLPDVFEQGTAIILLGGAQPVIPPNL